MIAFPRVCVFAFVMLAAAVRGQSLDSQVSRLFEQRCAECHVGKGNLTKKGAKGKDPVLNATTTRLALDQSNHLVPGRPEESELFKRVTLPADHDDRMPKDPSPPLTADEKELLRRWIVGESAAAPRKFVSEAEVLQAIIADLPPKSDIVPAGAIRYLSLHNLWNLGPTEEPDANFEIYRAAISKVLNSLSWKARIVVPRAIGPNNLLLRINLYEYGWTEAMWHFFTERNPYSFVHPELDFEIARRSYTNDPIMLRADWFVFAAAQPPFYHETLYRAAVPGMLDPKGVADSVLERYLGVDVNANLRASLTAGNANAHDVLLGKAPALNAGLPVLRAGFKNSGVSQANRMIERHALADGRAYWKSYDFNLARHQDEGDLFQRPLGPRGAGLSEKLAFEHDGGEIIFNLPNGLQAYLLVTAAGKLLARAPSEIVQDRNRRDGIIINGISCMKCHDAGMKRPPGAEGGRVRDEIRPGVEPLLFAFTPDERRALQNLHPDEARLNAAVDADAARFTAAVRAAKADGLGVEPVSFLYERFLRDITANALLTELDIDPAAVKVPLAQVMRESANDIIKTKAAQLGRGFRRAELIPLFQALAGELSDKPLRSFVPVDYEEFVGIVNANASAVPRQGSAFEIPGLGLKLLWVAPGSFVMGSPRWPEYKRDPKDLDSQDDINGPPTRVRLTRGYWLGQFELTNAQYKAVMGQKPPSRTEGANQPVDYMDWDEAMAFCAKLTERERAAGRIPAGFRYTLPTEAQWEFACRAGTTGDFAGPIEELGWVRKEGPSKDQDPKPVGLKRPNAWGFFDMHGNVSEWCLDIQTESAYAKWIYPGGEVADYVRLGKPDKFRALTRGGSVNATAIAARSYVRDYAPLNNRVADPGMRVALAFGK